jgi:hypothetical protein
MLAPTLKSVKHYLTLILNHNDTIKTNVNAMNAGYAGNGAKIDTEGVQKKRASFRFVGGVHGTPARSRSFSWCLCGEFIL